MTGGRIIGGGTGPGGGVQAVAPHAVLPIEINLTAVIMVVEGQAPLVYAARDGEGVLSLPSGPFDPLRHRTLEIGLRSFARAQAGLGLGYVEQLYTFGDRGRHASERGGGEAMESPHVVSIGYLALTRMERPGARFAELYALFPWEDWRGGKPAVIEAEILPALRAWAGQSSAKAAAADRRALSPKERIALYFGADAVPFDEEKVLERYELLYEAGLVPEAIRDGRAAGPARLSGEAMAFDHRRILATALGRIRGKLKYRPVVFELMPDTFTLTDLQTKVEAISGHHLHKQNFRRLVEQGGLVEPTGGQKVTGGRPAALFRFRREALTERPAPGFRLGRIG